MRVRSDVPPQGARRASRRRGASVIEATLLLPLFLLFWFGIVDWGITYWVHQSVVFRANEAARWAIVHGYDAAKIKNVLVYGTADPTDGSVGQFGLTPENVSVKLVCGGGAGCAYTGSEDPTNLRRLIITVSRHRWSHFTPGFAGTYTARDVVVSLPTEDLE